MRQVTAMVDHEIPERPALRLEPGDPVEVGERDTRWPAFVFVRAGQGEGWVPSRHLSAAAGRAVVIVAYDTTELPTRAGETLEVLAEDEPSGWLWCRSASGREGWVPVATVSTSA
jgi:SH3-like domain-containing protein